MNVYTVSLRRSLSPTYRIVAKNASEAKKIACRLDKQSKYLSFIYLVSDEKRSPAATELQECSHRSNYTTNLVKLIYHTPILKARGYCNAGQC